MSFGGCVRSECGLTTPTGGGINAHDGVVRETWVAAGQSGPLAYFDDKTLPVPLLQDEPRHHPLGSDALHSFPAVAALRGGPPA